MTRRRGAGAAKNEANPSLSGPVRDRYRGWRPDRRSRGTGQKERDVAPRTMTPHDRWMASVGDVDLDAVERTVLIASDSDIIAARQQGRAMALRLGFSSTDATLLATAISELARNIVLYAKSGALTLRPLEEASRRGVLVIACDQGQGIADVTRVMMGGYSTSGSLGLGLCGVRRIVDEFDIISEAGRGTTITLKKWIP